MIRIFRFILMYLLTAVPVICICQNLIPLGTWRTHIPYNRANHVLFADTRIFCITDNGLFYLDRSDNSLGILSRVNGLSDVVITASVYGSDGSLILGYDNGNLDIIRGNAIINFTGLKESASSYSRQINAIVVAGNMAYLAFDDGIVVFDLDKSEIFETWHDLGNTGSSIIVNSLAIFSDTIYAGTSEGVIAGAISPGVNLADFHNWKRFNDQDGLPQLPVSGLVNAANGILAAIDERYLYIYRGQSWDLIRDYIAEKILGISSVGTVISVVTGDGIELLDEYYNPVEITDPVIRDPKYCASDQDGKLWIADGLNGLVSNEGGSFESTYPEGPFVNEIYSIKNINNNIVILPPGIGSSGMPLRNDQGFSVYSQGKWKNYNNSGAVNQLTGPAALDIIDGEYDGITGNMVFASFGYGLITMNSQAQFSIIDENTPGSLLVNSNPPERNTLVTSLLKDNSGKTYMINFRSTAPLLSLNASGEWNSYTPPLSTPAMIVQLLKPSSTEIWMRPLPGWNDGILVYNETSGLSRKISSLKDSGGLPGAQVNDLAFDKDGMVWVATDKGVAYFPFPGNILADPQLNAIIPVFGNRHLLRGEYITSIAVDGANNKWIGTLKGAWLFSDDGSKLIHNFNAGNSPLLSDEISDITINDETGEVFFSTSKGLISYRGTATVPAGKTGEVKIFPNPVPPGFTGLVGIEGLASGSIVKITDLNGNLIFETESEGGTASWDTLGRSGNRVSTGVYMIFSATPEGENEYVGKLAIIR